MTKLEEYKKSQNEWRNIAGNQLSNANNLLITFSSALFVFILRSSKKNKIYFDSSKVFDFNIFTYWLSILLLSLSILFGFFVLISRLYDARISRHIVLTRQRYLSKHQIELPRNNFQEFEFYDRIFVLWKIIFYKLPFINSEKILSNKKINKEFNELRRPSKILGTITWKWTKLQLILFLLSGFLYLLHCL
ncbi:hypothetical protein [Empedobacter falsenii]